MPTTQDLPRARFVKMRMSKRHRKDGASEEPRLRRVAAADAQDRSTALRDHVTAVTAREDPIRLGTAPGLHARRRPSERRGPRDPLVSRIGRSSTGSGLNAAAATVRSPDQGKAVVMRIVRSLGAGAVTSAAPRFVVAIAFEARERVGSRRLGRGRVGVLVAAALLAGVALIAAVALVGVRGGVSSARSSERASAAGGFAALPVPLRGLVSGTLGRSERVFWVRRAGAGFVLANGAQGFSARFSDSGVRVSARGGRLALSLAGVGYGSSLRALGSRAPSADGNRVSYADAAFTQWFENGPLGLEQGFTLRAPPAGAERGPVTIALRVGGSLRARVVGGGEAVDFIARRGGVVLRYVGLRAIDARGHVLRAWLDTTGGRLLVRVDATGARYPLRIDPFVQQGSKLVGTGAVGDSEQGVSVALSSDGDTALVGGDEDNGGVGAVWVFTRSGTTWTQQGSKLVGTDAVGDANQGSSVALASDGNTALVGGDQDNGGVGAVWVFTRSGTTWTQQGSKLVGTGATGGYPGAGEGSSVALSSDGNTALVGGPGDNGGAGAVWAFTRSGTTWTQQGSKLVGTGGGGDFGKSVALSDDGDTALVGGPIGSAAGAAWVFTRSGTTWTQQGPMLVGSGAVGHAYQGTSVALSSDGNTALVGGQGDNLFVGATWVFTRSGATWTQQGSKLVGTGAGGTADQGYSVALSGDGSTALVGGDGGISDTSVVGAAWVFTRSGATWTQQGSKLVGTGAVGHAYQGYSVALSGDGDTALVGGFGDNRDVGAAWVFVTQLPPGTKTTKAKISSKHHQATFSFKAIGTATGFQCALVTKPKAHHKKPKPTFKACRSPKTYRHLKPGRYAFEVRAFNAAGADSTPPKKSFTIT